MNAASATGQHVADTPALDAVALLKAMVSFPSLSGQEGPLADFLEAYVGMRGLVVGRMDDNVFFRLGDGDDCLLLNSHLDVVPPAADHPYHPFDATDRDGVLFGRGVVDAKASGAAMTTALLRLARAGWSPPKGQVIVALTTCEETGGEYNGLETLRPHLPPLSGAVVGEPTGMQPCVAQKGLLILKGVARGKASHAARPHLGDNAITRAARDVARLEQLSLDRVDAFLGRPTVSVTTIQGGSARNAVPDTCTFTVDIRSTPAYSHGEIVDMIDAALESEVRIHSSRIIPVATDPEARIVRACRAAAPQAEPFGSPTASDWIFLHDVPTVKIGPGSSDYSHTADEQIPVSVVTDAVDTYEAIIRAYYA